MYVVALIRISLTIIFSRKHLKCQTWLPQGRKWSGKKIPQGQGKVREFHFKSEKILVFERSQGKVKFKSEYILYNLWT